MEVLNINVGVLGHVDSGKTSLVKALSTVLSTASLDKNPQSRERGITLDLGFSAFTVPLPEHLPRDLYSHLQFTLVDCPGHASLIRTIIGGAQILDMMLLVVDATKGMQAQTTECVVIGEAVMSSGADVIIILNKIDLLPEEERSDRLRQVQKDISAQLAGTKFSSASYVFCAAAVGGEKTAAASTQHAVSKNSKGKVKKRSKASGERTTGSGSSLDTRAAGVSDGGRSELADPPNKARAGASATCWEETSTMGVDAVAVELSQRARVPDRSAPAPLYFAFDHCFSVRGQGTILTGTVLTGEVKVNQLVEIPALRLQKRVKSMQMFRRPVSVARAGDRVGICLASLDAKLMERGVVTTPGSVRPISAAIALVRKVPAFTGQCLSGAYCHVSLGHATAMATATFFGASELSKRPLALFEACVNDEETFPAAKKDSNLEDKGGDLSLDDIAALPFPGKAAFAQQDLLVGRVNNDRDSTAGDSVGLDCEVSSAKGRGALQYCHLAFHTPVITPPSSVVLGSRLDNSSIPAGAAPTEARLDHSVDEGSGTGLSALEHCRIAFHGRLVVLSNGTDGVRKASSDAGSALEFGPDAGQLKLYTEKCKTGSVFRVGADGGHAGSRVEVFGKDLFKKETNMSPFVGMMLLTEDNCIGQLESAFGKGGRFKANFPLGTQVKVGDKLFLKFRKYFRDPSKRMHQDYLRESAVSERHPQAQQHQERRRRINAGSHGSSNPGDEDDASCHVQAAEATTASHVKDERETVEAAGQAAQETHEQRPNVLRDGVVDNIKDGTAVAGPTVVAIVSGLFSQEEDIRAIAKLGMAVRTDTGLVGRLKGPFGKLGKCKVEFTKGEDCLLQAGDRVFVLR